MPLGAWVKFWAKASALNQEWPKWASEQHSFCSMTVTLLIHLCFCRYCLLTEVNQVMKRWWASELVLSVIRIVFPEIPQRCYQHLENKKLHWQPEDEKVSRPDHLGGNHQADQRFTSLHSGFLQMPPFLYVQVPGHMQRSAVGRGAHRPPQAARRLAARGADGAEGPHAVLRRSHGGRTGIRPIPTEWRWLPPLPREQRNGPAQYPTDEML